MSKGKILLVEPDEDIREWVEAALEADGYEVWAVDSAEKGMELLDELGKCLLLIDNFDKVESDDENFDLLMRASENRILCIWMIHRKKSPFAFVLHGPSPYDVIFKQSIKEEDRIALRQATMAYLNRW